MSEVAIKWCFIFGMCGVNLRERPILRTIGKYEEYVIKHFREKGVL